MRHFLCVLAAGALAGALTAQPAFAWGPNGHRITGVIAERFLGPRAAGAVREILGAETLAQAATWPDDMRSAPDAFWQETASPLHYVEIPAGMTYADIGEQPDGNAVTALEQFAATLRDPGATLEQRQLALRFIIHIVGDLQQPLHVGNGVDRGGNSVQVTWFGAPTNLHWVWDVEMVHARELSYSEYADWLLAALTPRQLQAWADPDPLVWVAESQALRDTIYPAPAADGTLPDLEYDYVYRHRALVEQRLSQAGIRIAAYLNALFE